MIRLQALGALELHGADGREVQSVLAQPKRLAFLAYLAVQEGQAFCTRDQVVALFWPEQDHEGARAALNRALYYLRRALGDGVLLSRGDAIGVAPGAVWCDAAELEAAAAEGRHHAALALYRGDLLQGLHVSSSVEFEHWLDAKRERLRQMAVRSAWSLVEEEKRAGNAEAAVDWARWAVERCPYDEASVRKLISLLDGNGDRAGALREYERFARVLANELELAPAPESRALIAAIRAREGVVRTSDAPASANAESTTPVSGTERATSHDDPRATPAEEASRAATESPASDSVRALSSGRRWTARRGPRRMVGAALALSAAALLLAVLRPAPDPRVVLVSSLENRSGDAALDSLARTASDRLERALADVLESAIEMAPQEPVRVVRRERGVSAAALLAPWKRPGSVIRGAVYLEGGVPHLHARVVDVVRGGRAWVIPPIPSALGATDQAVGELAQRATGAVAVLLNPTLAEWLPRASAPPTYPALEEYLWGVNAQPGWDGGAHFARATELDTTFTWALLEAASPGRMLDRERAHAIVVELQKKRERLNRLQTAVLSSLVASETGDRQSKYTATALAAQIAPRRFLMEHALSAWNLNLPRQTLRLLDGVDAQTPGAGLPASWTLRTDLLHELRRHDEELALARKARVQMPRDRSAMFKEVRALAALGRSLEVEAVVDSALSLPNSMFFTPGALMLMAAQEFRAHGRAHESAMMARRSIDWYRSTPTMSNGKVGWHESRLADALYLAAELDEAGALYEQLLEKDPSWRVAYYGSLGAVAARKGDRATAEAYITALAGVDIPEEAEPYDVALARARIAALLGDAGRALAYLRAGYNGGQGVDLHADVDFEDVLAHNRAFQEFVRPKG